MVRTFDKEENTGKFGLISIEEFQVYLAEHGVNVSYVNKDMCVSYPATLQLRHGPHRPTRLMD